ncbi:MAG: flagellar type III secretion system pore protein FliP [Melioribacteraceae bacterium]|nr:flagellar type III secretion system pore protein FliP [Melioribacteraceae bacterium]
MKKGLIILGLISLFLLNSESVFAQQTKSLPLPKIGIDVGTSDNPEDLTVTLQLLLLMTILSLAPSILIMTTAYLRIIISFHFLKQALGTMQMPPNQLLAGVALFITFFVMAPTWEQVNENALQPYLNKEISADSAYTTGIKPVREFMFKSVRDEDLALFITFAEITQPQTRTELPTYILIPAYVLGELRAGFIIGFFLFVPFLMIDMIVSSILMSMGMMMLPPMMISLPFKILLFILVDGWNLIVGSLVRSFGA